MTARVLLTLFLIGCASKSLSPYLDEYKELKKEYEDGLVNCRDYFEQMQALLVPISTGEVKEEEDGVTSDDETPQRLKLIDDKQKVFQFIKYNRYPAKVVQDGHNFSSYIFNPYVQESNEFDLIYEDFTNKNDLAEGVSCEESGTILNFYSALIPNLKADFKRLIERNSFLFAIKNYINSKKFMRNEPLISTLVDLKILDLLVEHKLTEVKAKSIKKTLKYAEKMQDKIQEKFKIDLGNGTDLALESMVEEGEDDDDGDTDNSIDFKKLNKAHFAEVKLTKKLRKKINRLMKNF